MLGLLAAPRLAALTLAQRDGVVPVEVALGVLGAGAGAVSHQAVAGVAAEAHGAAGMRTRLAEEQPVGWRLREAAVGGWGEGQNSTNQALDGPTSKQTPSRSRELHCAHHTLRLDKTQRTCDGEIQSQRGKERTATTRVSLGSRNKD